MTTVTTEQAERVVQDASARGFHVTVDEVFEYARQGYLPQSTVGDDYDQARDDCLEELLDEVQS